MFKAMLRSWFVRHRRFNRALIWFSGCDWSFHSKDSCAYEVCKLEIHSRAEDYESARWSLKRQFNKAS